MKIWEIYINLDRIDTIEKLCKVCNSYRNRFDVNIEYGRYVIDGASIIGVSTLVGKNVKINPITNDEKELNEFYLEVEKTGAYIK